jgi:twinkle protein
MCCPREFVNVRDFLDPDEFLSDVHRSAYRALLKLDEQDRLELAGLADILGDAVYSYDFSQGTANLTGNAGEIKRAAYKRKIENATLRIAGLAQDKTVLPQEIYDEICSLALVDVPGNIDGIIRAHDYFDKLMCLAADPRQNIYSTGISKLDPYYQIKKGDICLIGGIPSSGKSEFLDAMLLNETTIHGWKFAYFTPENYPIQFHLRKLIEKLKGKSFKHDSTNHIEQPEIVSAMDFINERFFWVYPKESECTPESLLSKFKYLIRKEKINGVVIDPWNELDNYRPSKISETDYIKMCLTKFRRFAREHNLVFYLVVHPPKLMKNMQGKYDAPTLYEYAGSAHWRNKTDVALCIHREQSPGEFGNISPEVEVHIQKVRYKAVGQVGMITFNYDVETGRYE